MSSKPSIQINSNSENGFYNPVIQSEISTLQKIKLTVYPSLQIFFRHIPKIQSASLYEVEDHPFV